MEITINKPIIVDGKTYSKAYFNIGPISQQSNNPIAIRLIPFNDEGELTAEHHIAIIMDNHDDFAALVQDIVNKKNL